MSLLENENDKCEHRKLIEPVVAELRSFNARKLEPPVIVTLNWNKWSDTVLVLFSVCDHGDPFVLDQAIEVISFWTRMEMKIPSLHENSILA